MEYKQPFHGVRKPTPREGPMISITVRVLLAHVNGNMPLFKLTRIELNCMPREHDECNA